MTAALWAWFQAWYDAGYDAGYRDGDAGYRPHAYGVNDAYDDGYSDALFMAAA